MTEIVLSALAHTWLVDLDGTVFVHNGHLYGEDRLAPGVAGFWACIPPGDVIVLLSAREEAARSATLAALKREGLRYDHVLFGLPKGERVLINDGKPGGLVTALAVPVARDAGLTDLSVTIDASL
jgi:hypothetical protein